MANYNLTQTGAQVQALLDTVAAGYIYMGVADLTTTPDTTNPNVCYLLKAVGTYTNFGNIQHASGIGIALWNGTAWSYQNVPSSTVVATDATPTEGSTNPVQSGGVWPMYQYFVDYELPPTQIGYLDTSTWMINNGNTTRGSVVLDNATTITKFELIDSNLYRYILYGNDDGLGNSFTRITTLNWSSEAYTTPIPYKYIVILLKKTDNSTFTTEPCVKVYGNAQTLPQRVSTLEQEVASMPDTSILEEKVDAVTEGELGRMVTSIWTLGYIWNLTGLSQSANARGEISGEYISTSDNLTIKFTDWENCNIQMIQYQSESVHYAQSFTTEQAFNRFFVTRPNRAGYKYKFGIYYKSTSATMTEENRRDGLFTFQDGAGTLTAIDSVARGANSELVYIEIGDSITYLADNKYETSYDDTGTTQTGYKGWGYGRYLCNAMGISYANHYPQGANGRNFAAYYEEWQAGHWSFPNDPDIVTIELGTNDWGTMHYKLGTQADYINDTYVSGYSNTNCTMYGAMRKLVDKVRSLTTGTKVPQIAFISPLQRGAFVYVSNTSAADQYGMIFTKSPIKLGTNGYEYVTNTPEYFPNDGFTLKDVYDAIKWVCEYEGFTFVDFFTDSIVPKKYLRMEQEDSQSVADEVRANTFVKQDILRDNLHPTDKGFQLMGCRVIEALRKLFYDRMVERQ